MNKWLILSFLLVTSPTIIGVNTPIFNVSIEESYLSGTATYETGGTFSDSEGTEEFWFPISVLDFPINIPIQTITGTAANSTDKPRSM